MFGLPIRNDHDGRSLGKTRAHDIGRALRHDCGCGSHDHHGCFGPGCERCDGERDRGEPKASKNIHPLTDQKLLGNAPAVVSNTRVIAQDELDFLAINARAILLHIEAGTRFDLLAGSRKRPGHRENETDLDGLFGHGIDRSQRDECPSDQSPPHRSVLPSIRDQPVSPDRDTLTLERDVSLPLRNPTTGIPGYCAPAVSGQVTAVPRSSVMNWRRFMGSPEGQGSRTKYSRSQSGFRTVHRSKGGLLMSAPG